MHGVDGTYDVTENFVPNRLNVLADQVEAFSSSVMGLTMGCARCHNHKYDPIPQRDYYRLSAIFRTAYDPYDWLIPNKNVDDEVGKIDWRQRYLMGIPEAEGREIESQNAPYAKQIKQLEESLEQLAGSYRQKLLSEELAKYPDELRQDVNLALKVPSAKRSRLQRDLVEKFASPLNASIKNLEIHFPDFKMNSEKTRRAIRKLEENLKPQPRIRALFDMGGAPTPTHLFVEASISNSGPRVEPGVPSSATRWNCTLQRFQAQMETRRQWASASPCALADPAQSSADLSRHGESCLAKSFWQGPGDNDRKLRQDRIASVSPRLVGLVGY